MRRNFLWTLAGNIIYAGSQWGILVVLAKLGSPELVGRFALGLAVTAPVILCTNLDLRVVQATDTKYQYRFGDYLSLRFITITLALIIIAGLVLVVGYQWETALLILIIGLAKGVESISDLCYGRLQQQEQMNYIAKSMIIKGSLSLAALSAGIYLTGSILWGAAGLVAAWVLVLVSYDIRSTGAVLRASLWSAGHVEPQQVPRTITLLQPRWNIRALGRLTWLALPLGFTALLISLSPNIPRYFVERYQGEYELGIFAAIFYLVLAGNTVMQALGASAVPRLARYYAARNDAAFRGLLLKLVGVGVLGGVTGVLVALVAGREVLVFLYSPEYSMYVDVLRWVMVAGGFGYVGIVLGYAISATRRYARFVIPYSVITISTIGASAFLIPSFGLFGAAWVSGVTSSVTVVTLLTSLVSGRRQA